MSATTVSRVLDQAEGLGTIEWIYFEGGEPFLHYGLLLDGVEAAFSRGFKVGIVTNAFWATDPKQARNRLLPLADRVQDFTVSTDSYHGDTDMARRAQCALREAEKLGMPVDRIRVADPDQATEPDPSKRKGSELFYRGRAAVGLAARAPGHPAGLFDRCPHEDLLEPGRVHLDALGWVHVCQGITLGNFLEQTLVEILGNTDPREHPVLGPLIRGGPAELARTYGIRPEPAYADACHFCYATRCRLRHRFPQVLGPNPMYGPAPH